MANGTSMATFNPVEITMSNTSVSAMSSAGNFTVSYNGYPGSLAVSPARTAVSVMRDPSGYSSAMIEPTRSPRPGSRLTSQVE